MNGFEILPSAGGGSDPLKLDLAGGTMTGQLVLNNASATGALNISPTWNNGAITFAGIYMRATNTASGASSKLLDLGTVAAGSLVDVDTNGYLNLVGGGFTTASIRFGGANTGISGSAGSRLDFIVSGVQVLTCDLNGLSSSSPRFAAMKYSFNPFGFTGPELRSGAGSPEGVVTADPGSIYFNSSGGAPYYKNTGTGNTGWILLT